VSNSNTSAVSTNQPAGKRGVIDQFEGDLATIVFDDNEQLVIARQTLPANARVGDVVTVRPPDSPTADAAAQSFSVGASATPSIEVEADDTAASQKRVRDLLDDIFKK
jgi:hypothetical protein